VFRANKDYLITNTDRGGGLLIVISKPLHGLKRSCDFETTEEFVWVKLPVGKDFNLLIVHFSFYLGL
jgi:hypothetical protein